MSSAGSSLHSRQPTVSSRLETDPLPPPSLAFRTAFATTQPLSITIAQPLPGFPRPADRVGALLISPPRSSAPSPQRHIETIPTRQRVRPSSGFFDLDRQVFAPYPCHIDEADSGFGSLSTKIDRCEILALHPVGFRYSDHLDPQRRAAVRSTFS